MTRQKKYILIISLLVVALIILVSAGKYLNFYNISFTIGTLDFTAYSIFTCVVALGSLIITSFYFLKYSEKRIRSLRAIRASNKELLIKTLYITTLSVTFLIALGTLGIDMTALTVLGGSIGIGLGFGLQKLAANYIMGIILLFEKSFEIGDLIELNDHTIGFVIQVGGRYILIETFDGKKMMIPNEEFVNHKIINWTHRNSTLRLEIEIEVLPQEDIVKIKKIILEAAQQSSYCLKNPYPFCVLKDIRDGKIIFALLFWTGDIKAGYLIPKSEVKLEIWAALQKNNVEMPVPIRKIVR